MGLLWRLAKGEESLFFQFSKFGLSLGRSDLKKKEISKVAGEILGDTDGVAMSGAKLMDFCQGAGVIPRQNGGGQSAGFNRASEAKDFEDVIEGNTFSSKADQLFEGGFGVPQAALSLASEEDKGFIRDFDFFCLGNFLEVGADERIGDPTKIEALAAGKDGGREFLNFRRGKDEFDVGGGLFEGFEKGVEGFGGEHVHFVDDIDFEFSTGGGVGNAFPKFLDAFNAPIGGAVDLQDVEASALLDFFANIVIRIEIGLGSFGAVEGFGEDAGGGGFADPAGPNKKKRMGQASL